MKDTKAYWDRHYSSTRTTQLLQSVYGYQSSITTTCAIDATSKYTRYRALRQTGNTLGDGHIRYPNLSLDGKAGGNARYAMTISVKGSPYMQSLFNTTYAQYSSSGLRAYPNTALPQHAGKEVTQYTFGTKMLPIFTALHSL